MYNKIEKVTHNLYIFLILRPVGCQAGSCYFQKVLLFHFFKGKSLVRKSIVVL